MSTVIRGLFVSPTFGAFFAVDFGFFADFSELAAVFFLDVITSIPRCRVLPRSPSCLCHESSQFSIRRPFARRARANGRRIENCELSWQRHEGDRGNTLQWGIDVMTSKKKPAAKSKNSAKKPK